MTGAAAATWQFWIDRGGTFTDIVARDGDGAYHISKLLSDGPEQYADAAVEGIRRTLGLDADAPLPAGEIAHVKMGTTVATNALLERRGASTLLVLNSGFADLLEIGRQARPKLFDLDIQKSSPLYTDVVEVDGRVSCTGEVLAALDEAKAEAAFKAARERGLTSCAIALIHAWTFPEMEARLAAMARDCGFEHVSASHEVSAIAGLVPRAATAVVDAYLSPVLRHYVDQVSSALGEADLYFMQSSGGLTGVGSFRGKDAVLSGPAGGVVGAARTAETLGMSCVIGFDMGGTSTDVSAYDGAFERAYDTEIDNIPVRAPMMDIHTVAAGGGSILRFESGRLQVGPESAGANPGPAGYRRGGPLTLTDANILLGRIPPDHFPHVFGPSGSEPLDTGAVETGFAAMARAMSEETGRTHDPRDVAEGALQVGVSNMARAIKTVTTDKGRDLDGFALQCFGGAGGQHACRVADELGLDTVLIHPFAGVLSAFGMGLADQSAMQRVSVERPLDDGTVAAARVRLEQIADMLTSGPDETGTATLRQTASLRYDGTDTTISVDMANASAMREAFEAVHKALFGFTTPERGVTIESVTVDRIQRGEAPLLPPLERSPSKAAVPIEDTELWSGGRPVSAHVFERATLRPGMVLAGPALIVETTGTTVLEDGWEAAVAERGDLILTRSTPRRRPALDADGPPDAVMLELFNNMFMAVAERMGGVLRDTATSVNIKERLDFSCALFDRDGGLIANAPHMPVHLGAMGESVRAVLASRGDTLKPGDMIALNNPFNGGTHLPDVTVIAPVFDETGTVLKFFVGNRGHHADIGGLTPGSTPPGSTKLEDEGVILDDVMVRDGGVFREEEVRALLADAPYPARNPDANISDLLAQVAANQAGIREVHALAARYGWDGIAAYTRHVMDNAEESVRRVIDRLTDGALTLDLDDGATLYVAVRVDREARSAVIDFTGTSAQRPGNFNAPPAVSRAAVLYVFRCLVDEDLPLNEGCMRPLELIIPNGSFLSPAQGAAVVAGNTEVSQLICNALLGALGASAASQGTMNNLLFGNGAFQYYETICGGAGAGPGFDGAHAVHTHMTNTRITDPEILEMRHPVRLEHFGIRRGSGGAGRFQGGNGSVRTIRMLSDVTVSLVSSSRRVAPFGLNGGGDGAPGRQWIERASGACEGIDGVSETELKAGDAIVIETPGGGGYGAV